jgi:hypothetical protein
LFVRVVFGGWPRPMRYFAQPHVYAETKGARVTLEAGADYDEACTYAIETVELDAIPRTVRKLSEGSKTATHVVVHVPNSFDAATLERVLRATESSGLTLSFAASYRPPERKSEPDCVPSTQIFDGPSLYDPFQESWAIFGACNARCAHESALEEDPCLKRCLRGSN